MRSRIPPCPGMSAPASLILRSRFTAENVTSPIKPVTASIAPINKANGILKGVRKLCSSTAITIVVPTPPRNPSHVLFGLTSGTILFLPNILPQTYWATSLPWFKIARNKISPAPPAAWLSVAGNCISIAACEIAKTVIIKPQLIAETDFKKPSVCLARIRRKGSRKKTQIGMNTINSP